MFRKKKDADRSRRDLVAIAVDTCRRGGSVELPDLGGPGRVCGGTAGRGRFALRSHACGLEKKKPRDERGFDRPDRWRGTIWGFREDPVVQIQRGGLDFVPQDALLWGSPLN